MTNEHTSGQRLFATLRQFTQPRPQTERCELCSAELACEHDHLFEHQTQRLLCACQPCSLLFDGAEVRRFRRVPRHTLYLQNMQMSDAQWDGLLIPINLAFFFHSSPAGKVVAYYPSPAGATESLLSLETWQSLSAEHPILCEMRPDVEALLVNRVGQKREHYLAPIDKCYKLVGVIRMNWRGLSGGTEVWSEIEAFFDELKQTAELFE